MKIKQLSLSAGPAGVILPDTVRDVSEQEAADMIAGGYAEAINSGPSSKLLDRAREQRLVDEAIALPPRTGEAIR